MIRLTAFLFALAVAVAQSQQAVRSYEGTLTIPTYEHTARETAPPLFRTSTVAGLYPFTTYVLPFKEDGPKPKTYQALMVENEYLKLTYIPEFGGRIFSLYDKIRNREVFYRNDVIKPAPYNPRNSWPQSGLELTGPHDLHMLTLYSEPYWANKIVRRDDGSISLVLGELDPVYQMKVNLTATLHPGIAALEIGVSCYNPKPGRMPQMLWINTAVPATPKTRFIYPMSRTVGHTTADIADWPLHNGIDYSWDRNNKNMLGVFGIDIYDNFQGAYQVDNDYGVFRYADRRVVQGMKMWTFGYGPGSKSHEHAYTDNAGPYVELQSGRYVWDGHYEWVVPHEVEGWTEWWMPVAGTNGLTTLTRDVALNLEMQNKDLRLVLAATRVVPGATLRVTSGAGELLRQAINLDPAKPVRVSFQLKNEKAKGLVVNVTDAKGNMLLDYHRPDSDPGRKEYTPFTKPLEQPSKAPEEMSVEELTLAAEFKLKELDATGAQVLIEKALQRDPEYSRAHLLLGIRDFNSSSYQSAAEHLQKAIERDPYCDVAYYYLAMSQFALGDKAKAERNLYYIWADSSYFGAREYHLGRLALLNKDYEKSIDHLQRAIAVNAGDLLSRLALSVAHRESGDRTQALEQIHALKALDPTSRTAQAEEYFLTGAAEAKAELSRLLGGQSQEAIGVSIFYRNLERWNDAVRILRLTEETNHDPWGTPPEFYYTLAYCQRRAGAADAAADSMRIAKTAAANVDRFPYRPESEAPFVEAVKIAPDDATARYGLACLLYFQDRAPEAIAQWETAARLNRNDFATRRALGLAYAERGSGLEKAAAELERAVELNPEHVRTLNDLSNLYARAGQFNEQLAVLQKALERSPKDDDLAEGVLTADLMKGRYADAERLIAARQFAPRHRTYGLRDKYRSMQYALGAQAFNRGDYRQALDLFRSALTPPASLGVDDFESQSAPRAQYYIGRTLAALGKDAEAKQAFASSAQGVAHLSGDRDSWNSENFFMTLSLEQLGRKDEAARLRVQFENFAKSETDAAMAERRAEARYLLGLIAKRNGKPGEASRWMRQALDARPDLLAARMELRGDVLDPMKTAQ